MQWKTAGVVRILTGLVAKILAVFAFLALPLVARADETAYMLNGSEEFGVIDLTTGAFSEIGSPEGLQLSGLGESGGDIYGGAFSGDTLYEVNPATGSVTAIGIGSIDYADTGSTTTGLYALGYTAGNILSLYSINPSTGIATLIGSTGLTATATFGLSTNSSVLYLDENGTLYSVNTSTGAVTQIGSTGGTPEIGAMIFEGGTLYAGNNTASPSQVDTLNQSTGAVTDGPDTSGGADKFWGLDPTPEPATMLLFGTGLLAIGEILRRRRARTKETEPVERRFRPGCVRL